MEDIVYIAIGISQVILIIYLYRKNKSKNKQENKTSQVAKEYPFDVLRSMAINTTPGALLLSLPEDVTGVYSVVMDWNMGDDTVTLIANLTGDASLYVKSGGAIIGGGKYPEVAAAAQKFVSEAQNYVSQTIATDTTPLPDKNIVKFYLLTNKGKYTGEDDIKKLEDKSSAWTPLFESGRAVIACLQLNAGVR